MNHLALKSILLLAGTALTLTGCEAQSRTNRSTPGNVSVAVPRDGALAQKIPAAARLVAEAERANSVVFTTPEDGRLYVYSETENRLITTMDVKANERIELGEVDLSNPQPPLFRLSKGGTPFMQRDGRPLVVQFYFQPLPPVGLESTN